MKHYFNVLFNWFTSIDFSIITKNSQGWGLQNFNRVEKVEEMQERDDEADNFYKFTQKNDSLNNSFVSIVSKLVEHNKSLVQILLYEYSENTRNEKCHVYYSVILTIIFSIY